MDIYYLGDPYRPLSNPDGKSRIVRPLGTTPAAYAKARQRAIEDAAGRGTRTAAVVVGHTDVRRVLRRDGFSVLAASAADDHGLLLYAERLLMIHAAMVLVPPLAAVRQLAAQEDHCPVLPMVVAYRVEAAMSVPLDGFSVGYDLSCRGYRVITLGDYGYAQHGPTVYDEFGTAKKWRNGYEEALGELLGLRSRDKR